jgi:imidazoleglycerol-phosphate dehydratase / histidinol-phosphatase
MKKVLFIDRDGTILKEPEDEQVDSLEKLSFIPGAISGLTSIAKELDYELVMVTNQDGLGTDSFPEESFWPAQNKMIDILKGEGITFSEILIDRTFPEENAPSRKPGTGLVRHYMAGAYDLTRSFVIGDRLTDVEFAKNIGCNAIWINSGDSDDAALTTKDWNSIYRFLKKQPRIAEVKRKTQETDICVMLNLDGEGKYDVSTGLGFFDHMLSQTARHGNLDLNIKAKGDLQIDEHHTIEDVALVMGEAMKKALGSKKGIERYGFYLPMDDSIAQLSLDFGGRPWLVWDVSFSREKIGDVPTELFMHFFKSFSDTAGCNLNIKANGINDHHKAEAIFKAFGKAIKAAVKMDGNYLLPSTKGKL